MRLLERFKEKWNIESNFQLGIILVVFAISGSLSMFLSKPLLNSLGVDQEVMNPYAFWPLRVLIMFFSYYAVLISVGSIFGQHKFFIAFSKKTFGRFIGQ